ncbi:MAG: PCRF domain-containing protein, partial [Holosporales bacterium]|nr:PCRF domain-containing protein [Holosporales bacterium]
MLEKLEQQAANPSLWDDVSHAQQLLKRRATVQNVVNQVQSLTQRFQEARELIKLAKESDDQAFYDECVNSLVELKSEIYKAQVISLLSEDADENNCFLEINSGAGGTEAQDWVAMLARMYSRWAEDRGYKCE